MEGLQQIGQLQTTGSDGRSHVIYVYNHSNTTSGSSMPHFITSEGWEAVPIRDGVFRVYGTGMILRQMIAR